MKDSHVLISLGDLHPHPRNPRIEPRQEVVDQLAARMAGGLDPAHALIVRSLDNAYQIISGHHRWLAARLSGLSEVPCWVKDLSDDDAYMQLMLCNTQSELHPLEEGKHAAESGMDLKSYAEMAGKDRSTLARKVMGWRVLSVCHVAHAQVYDSWRNLAEIHAAPKWLWVALVTKMVGSSWTVDQTRKQVQAVKEVSEPHPFLNREMIASYFIDKIVSADEIKRMGTAIESAKVRDDDEDKLRTAMMTQLKNTPASKLSDVQETVARYESEQGRRDTLAQAAMIERQRAEESARQRVANLRRNCSLETWKQLSKEERNLLLVPSNEDGGTFNRQENDAIEWAQWSWNPVTGCKHDCPYCYARDIAISQRFAKIYPNGFEPTFRCASLGAPSATRVPKEAIVDTRLRNVFTCSMADLFGRWVPLEWIDAVMATVRDSPEWNFLFLTKFPQRIKEVQIPDNAWMGTTVDMQARVGNAEKAFADVGGKVKWLSVEPMIEPLRFNRLDLFDWVVIGGASSSANTPPWRPPFTWIYDLVTQCREAGCKIYMKTNLMGDGKEIRGSYQANARIIELPFDSPLILDSQSSAPHSMRYLGNNND